MENFETQQNIPEEWQEKAAELLPVVKQIYNSFDSTDADKAWDRITDFKEIQEGQDRHPENCFLWSLIVPGNASGQNYNELDIPDPADVNGAGLIEKLIIEELPKLAESEDVQEELEEAA